jgi:hypothetical protein
VFIPIILSVVPRCLSHGSCLPQYVQMPCGPSINQRQLCFQPHLRALMANSCLGRLGGLEVIRKGLLPANGICSLMILAPPVLFDTLPERLFIFHLISPFLSWKTAVESIRAMERKKFPPCCLIHVSAPAFLLPICQLLKHPRTLSTGIQHHLQKAQILCFHREGLDKQITDLAGRS